MSTIAAYPLQIKLIHHYIVVTSTEWGINVNAGNLAKQSTEPGAATAYSIGQAVLQAFSELQSKLEESIKKKEVLPKASFIPTQAAKPLSIRDAAQWLSVSQGTVRRLVSQGKLKSTSSPGGHRRFLKEDLNKVLENIKRK